MRTSGRQQNQRATRVQLPDYDESLLLDRSYVPLPQDGFGEESLDSTGTKQNFGPINTSWAVLLYLACIIGYLIFLVCPTPFLAKGHSFAIQATLHLVILVLAMVLESYLRLNHRWRQQLGYLRFYRSTRHLLSIPFYGAAIATAALLLAELWPKATGWLSQHTILVIISALESVAALFFAVLYIHRVYQHNKREAIPDAQRYLQSALYTSFEGNLGQQDAVVEQQGELIRFLQRRCDNLAREVLHLQTREDSRFIEEQQGDAAGHLEHLLATREQEMRALLAEKESLYSQNRQTWSLLEERTQENNQLQLIKQQHMEENSRLRATLEEWSHRNAKLEQRLNQAKKNPQDPAHAQKRSADHSPVRD